MERNDISELVEAGIPVGMDRFDCGWWGKHHPPRIEDGVIVIEVGVGYQSHKHYHFQNLYVVEVADNIALIEMRKGGDLYGAGLWHYLIGVDGVPFIAQVPNTIDTLAEALEYLKPAEVKRAEESGLDVKRQGDWFFVPISRTPRGEVEFGVPLDDDHVADEMVRLKTVTYVRGTVSHSQHQSLFLNGWHKAVRNKAIRTGRLFATTGGGD